VSVGNTVARNSSYLMLSNLANRGLGFASSVIVARLLGPGGYGHYSFIIALVTLVALLWNIGLNTVVTREIAKNRSLTAKYVASASILKTVLLVPVVLIVLIYLMMAGRQSTIILSVLLFALSRYYLDIAAVFNSALSAHRRMGVPSLLGSLRSVILLVGVIIVSMRGLNLVGIMSCYAISSATVVVIGIIYYRSQYASLPWIINRRELSDVLVKSMPFFIISALSITLFRIDHLMLAGLSDARQLGLYGAGYTIFEVVVSIFPMVITSAIFPVLSELHRVDQDAMKNLYKVLLKYYCIVGIPASCGVFLLAPRIMVAIYGKDYADGSAALRVLGCAVIVFFLSTLMSWTLTAGGQQRLLMISTSVALMLNAGLNYLLIPRYGALAAAYTTLVCEVVQVLVYYSCSPLLRHSSLKVNGDWLRVGFATATMGLVVIGLDLPVAGSPMWFGLVLQACAGALAYLGVATLSGAIKKNELKMILNA